MDRDEVGSEGTQKINTILQSNGFKTLIFNWDQTFISSNGSTVNIPEKIKDPGDMSKTQLRWLRKAEII